MQLQYQVYTSGNPYGIAEDIVFSMPCRSKASVSTVFFILYYNFWIAFVPPMTKKKYSLGRWWLWTRQGCYIWWLPTTEISQGECETSYFLSYSINICIFDIQRNKSQLLLYTYNCFMILFTCAWTLSICIICEFHHSCQNIIFCRRKLSCWLRKNVLLT